MNLLTTENPKYCAYGSNMDPDQMDLRRIEGPAKLKNLGRWSSDSLELAKASSLGKGIIKNYELNFHKKKAGSTDFEGFANISKKDNSQVEVVVYQVTKQHLQVLDFYEGVKNFHYTPEQISVEICSTSEILEATVYIAHPTKIDERCKPSKNYLEKLIAGATEFQFSDETIRRLKEWETI